MRLITPLAKVRGHGSAHDGAHHWWAQRISALAILPLSIWFVVSLLSLLGAGADDVQTWFESPIHALLMALLMLAVLYHAYQGLKVVFEDYIRCHVMQLGLIVGARFVMTLAGAAAVMAIVKMHLAGW